MQSLAHPEGGAFTRFLAYIRRHWFMYMLALPGVCFLLVFSYAPMYGLLLAFKKYSLRLGIMGSPWVWFKNFEIFKDAGLRRIIWNTVVINCYHLIFGFTFVILLALLINEMRIKWLKNTTQTLIYLPYFISWVVFSGIITTFLSLDRGLVNAIIAALGGKPVDFLGENDLFRGILVITNIIKTAGYSTIIYLAAIAGVNPELYESAKVDGANRFHMMIHITLPRIYPTIAVLLIMQIASMFSSNFDQVFNLYNAFVLNKGDTLSTYIYRVTLRGKTGVQWETGTVLGLVFNTISFVIIILANKVVRKMDVMGIF